MYESFGISETEIEKIMDQYVISEGSGISLDNLRYAFQLVVAENNKAVKKHVQEMIDEAIEEKIQKIKTRPVFFRRVFLA